MFRKPTNGPNQNVLQIWGNKESMNMNSMILTNIQSSNYYKQKLSELKTYHEIIDEIYYRVNHLEPWEKGSRRTQGLTGMCGGVRGVGGGGIVSTCFCLLYKMYTLKLSKKQVVGLMTHADSPYIRAIGFMYIRYTQDPKDLYSWYSDYLDDEEEIDVKAGGGGTMLIGHMLRQWLTRLEWYDTLFPRIPVPIQNEIMFELRNRYGDRGDPVTAPIGGGGRDYEGRERSSSPYRIRSRERTRSPYRNQRSRSKSPYKSNQRHRSRTRSRSPKRENRDRRSRSGSRSHHKSKRRHRSRSNSSDRHSKKSSSHKRDDRDHESSAERHRRRHHKKSSHKKSSRDKEADSGRERGHKKSRRSRSRSRSRGSHQDERKKDTHSTGSDNSHAISKMDYLKKYRDESD